MTDAGELKTMAQAGITALHLTAAKTDWAAGGNHVTGFATYEKADGSHGWAADVGLGYEADGWKATVESNLVRVTQSGGLVYGLSSDNTALNLDLSGQGLDGAMGGNGADAIQIRSRGQPRLCLLPYRPVPPKKPEFFLPAAANDPSYLATA